MGKGNNWIHYLSSPSSCTGAGCINGDNWYWETEANNTLALTSSHLTAININVKSDSFQVWHIIFSSTDYSWPLLFAVSIRGFDYSRTQKVPQNSEKWGKTEALIFTGLIRSVARETCTRNVFNLYLVNWIRTRSVISKTIWFPPYQKLFGNKTGFRPVSWQQQVKFMYFPAD